MAPRISQSEFTALCDHAYRVCRRRYGVVATSTRTLRLLIDLYVSHYTREDQGWLLPLRDRIRQPPAVGATQTLGSVIKSTQDPVLRVLAIWLRGRCGRSAGTRLLTKFSKHPDFQTRKEAVRALRRMEAWALLREIAKNDSNARIRRLATPGPSRSYRDRLSVFASHVTRLEIEPAKGPLFVSSTFDPAQGRQPKSSSTIRAILERIRRTLSGAFGNRVTH